MTSINEQFDRLSKADRAVSYQLALNDVTAAMTELRTTHGLSITEALLLNVVEMRIERLKP